MKTLESMCARVAGNVRMRHITDATIAAEQAEYGMFWLRDYMKRVPCSKQNYLVSAIPKMAKGIPIADRIQRGRGF